MRKKFYAIMGKGLLALWSCGNRTTDQVSDNTILQDPDGTLLLNLEKATCYNDETNPSSNTAEWKIRVSKPGRFKVWLSSATMDTTRLKYMNSVKIFFMDNQIEGNPACDRIVQNSDEVTYPFYRADSYMGTFYISNPGDYIIQVISEKVIPREAMNELTSGPDETRLMSVILTPNTR
jgi:hypothetical protein